MVLPGSHAPDFQLHTLGGENWPLGDNLPAGPLVLVFFKISCPTCQFTFPFLDRLAAAEPGKLRVVAVSQDDAAGTTQFLERFAPHITTLLDTKGYPTCKAYGITHVPSVFQIEPDGTIGGAANGFHRQMLEDLGAIAGIEPFKPGEQIPEMRPG